MPATTLVMNVVCQWALERANPGFADTTEGIDGFEWNLALLNEIFDQISTQQLTIAGSGSNTQDLTTQINLVTESFAFNALLFLFVVPQGSGVNIAPGASNGLDIWGGTNSVNVPKNGVQMWGGDPAGTGLPVSSSHKTLLFTNLSSSPLTLNLLLAGQPV